MDPNDQHLSQNPGSHNLDVMELARNYTRHVGKLVGEALPPTGKVIDFGAGNGVQTMKILDPGPRILCVETDSRRVNDLLSLGYQVVRSIGVVADESSDGIYSVNCIEHILDDQKVVQQFFDKLKPGGTLVIYVPALPVLYSAMDSAVGHHRRYTKVGLTTLIASSGFNIESVRFVDSLGVLATIAFKLFGRSVGNPSKTAVWIYDNLLFPVSRVLDIPLKSITGKNLLVVAKKA